MLTSQRRKKKESTDESHRSVNKSQNLPDYSTRNFLAQRKRKSSHEVRKQEVSHDVLKQLREKLLMKKENSPYISRIDGNSRIQDSY